VRGGEKQSRNAITPGIEPTQDCKSLFDGVGVCRQCIAKKAIPERRSLEIRGRAQRGEWAWVQPSISGCLNPKPVATGPL